MCTIIGVLAVVVAFLPAAADVWAWCISVVSLVLLAAQQFSGYAFRQAYSAGEEIRRLLLLCDGLGEKPSASELEALRLRYGSLNDVGQAYYTSQLASGEGRLLMLTWESAFWSGHLLEVLTRRAFWLALSTSVVFLLVVVVAANFWGSWTFTPKAIVATLSLLVGLNLWVKYAESRNVSLSCKSYSMKCESLLRARTLEGELPPSRESLQVVLDYSAAMLTAFPPPDKLHAKLKPQLDAAWNRVAKEVTPDGAEHGKHG